jgi:hypothetical protein
VRRQSEESGRQRLDFTHELEMAHGLALRRPRSHLHNGIAHGAIVCCEQGRRPIEQSNRSLPQRPIAV